MGYFLTPEAETAVPARSLASPKTHVPLSRMQDAGHRYYSATLARWVSRDPLEEEGGINIVSFLGNEPLSRTDPFGLEWEVVRNHATRARVRTCSSQDTIDTLGQRLGLKEGRWLRDAAGTPVSSIQLGEWYTVPNNVIIAIGDMSGILWSGYLGAYQITQGAANGIRQVLDDKGYSNAALTEVLRPLESDGVRVAISDFMREMLSVRKGGIEGTAALGRLLSGSDSALPSYAFAPRDSNHVFASKSHWQVEAALVAAQTEADIYDRPLVVFYYGSIARAGATTDDEQLRCVVSKLIEPNVFRRLVVTETDYTKTNQATVLSEATMKGHYIKRYKTILRLRRIDGIRVWIPLSHDEDGYRLFLGG